MLLDSRNPLDKVAPPANPPTVPSLVSKFWPKVFVQNFFIEHYLLANAAHGELWNGSGMDTVEQ
jgi:hypothetical protein